MDDSETGQGGYVDKLNKIMHLCDRRHYETGIVFELQHRATKKVVTTAQEEYDMEMGTCTRMKNEHRWCFKPEDAELVAMWIGPHREQKQLLEKAKLK